MNGPSTSYPCEGEYPETYRSVKASLHLHPPVKGWWGFLSQFYHSVKVSSIHPHLKGPLAPTANEDHGDSYLGPTVKPLSHPP